MAVPQPRESSRIDTKLGPQGQVRAHEDLEASAEIDSEAVRRPGGGHSAESVLHVYMQQARAQQQVRLRTSAAEVQEAAAHHVGAVRLEGREGRTEIAPRPKPVDLRLNREALRDQAVAEAAPSVETGAERTLVVIRLANADGAEHFPLQEIFAECGRHAGQQSTARANFPARRRRMSYLG